MLAEMSFGSYDSEAERAQMLILYMTMGCKRYFGTALFFIIILNTEDMSTFPMQIGSSSFHSGISPYGEIKSCFKYYVFEVHTSFNAS